MNNSIPQVFITRSALQDVQKIARKQRRAETGGLILGKICQSQTGRAFIVTKATGPGANAQLKLHSFQPDIRHYQSMLKKFPQLKYLGEWHKHPRACSTWSQHDLKQAQKILAEEYLPEILCPICFYPAKSGELEVRFFYLNNSLPVFIPLSYNVIPDWQEPVYKQIIIEEAVASEFFASRKSTVIVKADVYPNDGIAHIFKKNYLANAEVLLVNPKRCLQMHLPMGIDIAISISKSSGKLNIKSYGLNQQAYSITTTVIAPNQDLFTRNNALLETSLLRDKHIAIIGLGSIGSVAALEMCRAGVGKLTLIDHDRLSIENLSRHSCDLTELGLAKVTAVKRRIGKILPATKVYDIKRNLNDDPDVALNICKNADLLLIATDTENSRRLGNWIAHELKIPVIFAGLLERAIGGRVWRVMPGETSCYECYAKVEPMENKGPVAYSQVNSNDDLTIQPGLGNDIAFITHLAVRYCLDSLMQPKAKTLTQTPYNAVFWFNKRHKKWNNRPLSIFHVEEIPASPNCHICKGVISDK